MVNIGQCAIDVTTRDVLIKLAMNEGLIAPLGFAEEHYLDAVQSRQFPQWVQRQALEQLVLSETLLCCAPSEFGTLQAWHGSLIEEGVLREVEPIAGHASHAEVPFEAFLGILRAGGHRGSVAEIRGRFSRANELLVEYQRLSNAHPGLENLALAAELAESTGIRTVVGTRDSRNLSREALATYRSLRRDLTSLNSIAAGFSNYMGALAVAREMTCLVRCPVRSEIAQKKVTSPGNGGEVIGAEMVLLRLVCKKLGRVPIRPTVRETLALARTSEASAMREMLGEWVAALRNGDVNILDRIETEVTQAQAGLLKAGALGGQSKWLTWIAVPVGVAEILAGSPGLVAFTLGAVAAGHEGERDQLERQHRWAMFAAS